MISAPGVRLKFDLQRGERLGPPHQLKGLKELTRSRGADVTWRIVTRQGGEGFMYVGDAAAVLDPSSSHGVIKALLTGVGAAQYAVRIIRLGYSDRTETLAFERWTRTMFFRDVQALHALRQPATSISRTPYDLLLQNSRGGSPDSRASVRQYSIALRDPASGEPMNIRNDQAVDPSSHSLMLNDGPLIDPLAAIGATKTMPLNFEGAYRFQSYREAKPGSLHGLVVERAEVLSLFDINRCLHVHERWHGRSKVTLKAAVVHQRTGVFECHADGLYYARNFRQEVKLSIDHDLLDLTKLSALFAQL